MKDQKRIILEFVEVDTDELDPRNRMQSIIESNPTVIHREFSVKEGFEVYVLGEEEQTLEKLAYVYGFGQQYEIPEAIDLGILSQTDTPDIEFKLNLINNKIN